MLDCPVGVGHAGKGRLVGRGCEAQFPSAVKVREYAERRLEQLGIDVRPGTVAERPNDRGVLLDSGASIDADVIIVAIGRRPNSDQASLDMLSIQIAPTGHIVVDEKMKAGRGIYAIGDLVAGPALAHKASDRPYQTSILVSS